eukprot:gene12097-12236_t
MQADDTRATETTHIESRFPFVTDSAHPAENTVQLASAASRQQDSFLISSSGPQPPQQLPAAELVSLAPRGQFGADDGRGMPQDDNRHALLQQIFQPAAGAPGTLEAFVTSHEDATGMSWSPAAPEATRGAQPRCAAVHSAAMSKPSAAVQGHRLADLLGAGLASSWYADPQQAAPPGSQRPSAATHDPVAQHVASHRKLQLAAPGTVSPGSMTTSPNMDLLYLLTSPDPSSHTFHTPFADRSANYIDIPPPAAGRGVAAGTGAAGAADGISWLPSHRTMSSGLPGLPDLSSGNLAPAASLGTRLSSGSRVLSAASSGALHSRTVTGSLPVSLPPQPSSTAAAAAPAGSAGRAAGTLLSGSGVVDGAEQDGAAPLAAAGLQDQQQQVVLRHTRQITCKTYLKRLNVTQYMSDHLLPRMEGSMRVSSQRQQGLVAAAAAIHGSAAKASDDEYEPARGSSSSSSLRMCVSAAGGNVSGAGKAAGGGSGRTYEMLFKVQVKLVDCSGQVWPVTYEGVMCAGQRHLRLTCGWSELIKAKRISIGDAITFERRGSNRAALAVTVQRAGQDPEQAYPGLLPAEDQISPRLNLAPPGQVQRADYQGSCVRRLSLEELQLLHRLSFGHRNQRSYLIVLYTPGSSACQAFEQEVERLATGLRHEPAFVAAALDVSPAAAAQFASAMLGVTNVPAVLLYPEAARGSLKFLGPDMSAHGMLAAINKARQAAWPPSSSSPGARDWQLFETTTPLTISALRAAAAQGGTDAVVATLQERMEPLTPSPLAAPQVAGLWSQGRMTLWGVMLLASLAFLAWDLRLADAWDDWCLAKRQAARLRDQHSNSLDTQFGDGRQSFALQPGPQPDQQEVVMLPQGGDAWVPDTTNRSGR